VLQSVERHPRCLSEVGKLLVGSHARRPSKANVAPFLSPWVNWGAVVIRQLTVWLRAQRYYGARARACQLQRSAASTWHRRGWSV